MKRFLGALQFLTVLPVGAQTVPTGESAIFFPLVGALLGLSAAGVDYLFSAHLGRPIAALLAVAWLIAATGCLHEDGLADVADALRAGRSQEKMMEIMLDSRIGSYGGAALTISCLLRWQALAHCGIDPIRALPVALAFSRASTAVLAASTATVGGGLGEDFKRGCTWPVVTAVVGQALALSLLAGWRLALAMTMASAVTILLARAYFLRRLGGVTGDCMGATCLAVEMTTLMVMAWR